MDIYVCVGITCMARAGGKRGRVSYTRTKTVRRHCVRQIQWGATKTLTQRNNFDGDALEPMADTLGDGVGYMQIVNCSSLLYSFLPRAGRLGTDQWLTSLFLLLFPVSICDLESGGQLRGGANVRGRASSCGPSGGCREELSCAWTEERSGASPSCGWAAWPGSSWP